MDAYLNRLRNRTVAPDRQIRSLVDLKAAFWPRHPTLVRMGCHDDPSQLPFPLRLVEDLTEMDIDFIHEALHLPRRCECRYQTMATCFHDVNECFLFWIKGGESRGPAPSRRN